MRKSYLRSGIDQEKNSENKRKGILENSDCQVKCNSGRERAVRLTEFGTLKIADFGSLLGSTYVVESRSAKPCTKSEKKIPDFWQNFQRRSSAFE